MVEKKDEKEDSLDVARKVATLQSGTLQMCAASYASIFSGDNIDSAKNVIRVPAHRPNISNLPQLSIGSPSIHGIVSSPTKIISSSTTDIPPLPTSLFSAASATHIGNVTTDFLPWSPYRSFSATIPGYLPLQAGFLGPKFSGKIFHINELTMCVVKIRLI